MNPPPPVASVARVSIVNHWRGRFKWLRADDRSVQPAHRWPGTVERMLGERVTRGQVLVEVDAQARLVVRPQHAVVNFGAARENLARALAEHVLVLDAEVVASQIQLEVG